MSTRSADCPVPRDRINQDVRDMPGCVTRQSRWSRASDSRVPTRRRSRSRRRAYQEVGAEGDEERRNTRLEAARAGGSCWFGGRRRGERAPPAEGTSKPLRRRGRAMRVFDSLWQ